MIGIEPGSLFGGRYEIVKCVGAGGMGAVYLACDPRYRDFLVALKVLYPGIIKTEEARERFRNEIVASYRVNHPNIVRAYEYFDQESFQAYAMEYVDGGDLLERMKQGPLDPPLVVSILKQVASGLAAVHAQGIVHRDLKPENILLTKKGEVKITDFGVARLKGAATLTQVGAMVGTPKYLPPEYVETGECDHRGDIYAIGVIGYEMLAGVSPFRAVSRLSLIVERFKSRVPPLEEVSPHCPADLARVIQKAMSVRISARYQSAQDLYQDLEQVEQGLTPIFAKRATPESRAISAVVPSNLAEEMLTESYNAAEFGKEASGIGKWKQMAWGLAMLVTTALCVATAVYWMRAPAIPQLNFLALPEGDYGGVISGMMSDHISTPLRLWRTQQGVYVLLGRARCAVVPVDEANSFSCGDLSFRFTIDSLEKRNAVGTIQELGWGSIGTWTLSETKPEA